MFADLSHSPSTSPVNRLTVLLWRLSNALESRQSHLLPVELGRLSDHLLCDIGVDPRHVRHSAQEASTNLDLLQREWP